MSNSDNPEPRRRHQRRWSGWEMIVTMSAVLLLTGCSTTTTKAPVSGLRPISPPVLIGWGVGFLNAPNPPSLVYETTDSSQPILKWESFPTAQDRKLDRGGSLSRIANVAYDLRIWRAENGWPAKLVYERKGLPAAEHQVEQPLAPATTFFWSVRAGFELGGQTRVSRWGFAPFPFAKLPGPSRARPAAGRVDQIQGPSYFRFQTPGS